MLARSIGSLGLVCILWSLAAGAHAETPFRAVVRVMHQTDPDLLDRVRGQTNDLDLEVIESHEDTLELSLGEQMSTADREALRYHAQAVVWFQPHESSLLVHVLVAGTGRLLVRRVLASPSSSASEVREGAALIVRSALRAIRAGATIGVARREALLDAEPPPATSRVETPAPTYPRLPYRPVPKTWSWISFLGGEVSYTGVTTQTALAFGLRAEARRFELGAALRLGLPSEHVDPFATVQLLQHEAVLFAGIPFDLSSRLRLCACLEVGVAANRRTTLASAPRTTPAPSRWTLSPLFGPELRLAWRAPIADGWTLGGSFAAGIDVVPIRPVVGYGLGEEHEFVSTQEPWVAQPRGQLTLELGAP